jgi:hypothetical protein
VTQELPHGLGKELLPKLCAGCHDLTFTISTGETEEGNTAFHRPNLHLVELLVSFIYSVLGFAPRD